MRSKHVLVILSLLIVVYVAWSKHSNGQSVFSKKILNQTNEAVAVVIKTMDAEVAMAVNSNLFSSDLGVVLSKITVRPASRHYKYAYQGQIIFSRKDGDNFIIYCFSPNIVRIDKRYYKTSEDVFEIAMALSRMDNLE